MPFVPAPNIIMAEMRYTFNGQNCENRVMIDNLGAPTPADLSAVAVDTWNFVETGLFPNLSHDILLREVVTTDLSTATGAQYTYAPDSTTAGEQGTRALPNECAFCVSLHTASRGRSARGRIYIPAIPAASMVDANNLSSSLVTLLVAAVQSYIDTIAGDSRQLVIVSYVADGAPRPGGPVYFPVLSAVATDSVIDSQRRRKPGVGT